jgi:periplasmic divalent cation tolerance protein
MVVKKTRSKTKTRANFKALVFFTTFSNSASAKKFALTVLDLKLAACINVLPKMTSFYVWKNKRVEDSEVLVIGKTSAQAFEKLKSQIKNIHPYEIPELISLEIKDGLPAYLHWIFSSLK